MDISIIDKDIDFYAISLEYFNSCTADLINTGTTPMSGTSAYNTLVFKHNYWLKINFYLVINFIVLG